jgi:hypothetical protein
VVVVVEQRMCHPAGLGVLQEEEEEEEVVVEGQWICSGGYRGRSCRTS